MDKELPDIDERAAKIVLKVFLPRIIHTFLEEGLLDKSKIKDRDYILKVIQENSKIINEMNVVLLMHDNFLKSARDAIIANRPEVAVVLIATAIEQMINIFYRQVLQEKGTLNNDEITELIRTSNNNAKFGWLLLLVAEYKISDDFRKDIVNLMELRNQIVHYKAISSPIKEEIPIKKHIQDFGLDKMMNIPDSLSELLDDALESVQREKPDYELAEEAIKLFVK